MIKKLLFLLFVPLFFMVNDAFAQETPRLRKMSPMETEHLHVTDTLKVPILLVDTVKVYSLGGTIFFADPVEFGSGGVVTDIKGQEGSLNYFTVDTLHVGRLDCIPTYTNISGSFTPDFRTSSCHVWTITGDVTLNNPRLYASAHDTRFEVVVIENVIGGHNITGWGSKWKDECDVFDGAAEITKIDIFYQNVNDVLTCQSQADNYFRNPTFNTGYIVEKPGGNYTNTYEDPGGNPTINWKDPGASDDVVYEDLAQTLTQKTILGASNVVDAYSCMAISDETTDLAVGTAKITFRLPYAMTLTSVRASVNTAPVGSTLIFDINEAGVSVLSTKLSIDASEETSTTAASAAVISDASIADDAELTIDIDQIGSTTPGKGAKICLIGTR